MTPESDLTLKKYVRGLNMMVEQAHQQQTPENFQAAALLERPAQLPPTLSRSSELWVSIVGTLASAGLAVLVLVGPVVSKVRMPEVVITDVSTNTQLSAKPQQNNEQPVGKTSRTINLPLPILRMDVLTTDGLWIRDEADRDTLKNRVPTYAPGDQQQFKSWNAGDLIKEPVDQLEVLKYDSGRQVIFAKIPTHDGKNQYWALSDTADTIDHNGTYIIAETADGKRSTPQQLTLSK